MRSPNFSNKDANWSSISFAVELDFNNDVTEADSLSLKCSGANMIR